MATRTRRTTSTQAALPFHRDGKHGGYRPGSGRKKLRPEQRAGVPHRRREKLASRHPVHVTVKLKKGLPSMRMPREYEVLKQCFAAACERFGFRLVHYSVMTNHLHLICEGTNRKAFSRGMQGLLIRIAKRLNRLWKRRGSIFAERYHEHILRTPREVRNALTYVLNNFWRHAFGPNPSGRTGIKGIDAFSSGHWFYGWKKKPKIPPLHDIDPPIATPHGWLLNTGWRRHGLIHVDEVPKRLPT